MKHLLILASLIGLLALPSAASADPLHWRGYDRPYGYHPARFDRFRGNGYYRNHLPRRYDRRFGPTYYGGNTWHVSVGRHYRRDRFDTGALLGGIVLGSVLGHGIASARADERVYYGAPVQSRTTVIRRTPVSPVATSQRRLLRDLSGRCFEIFRDGGGTETRVELDPSVCDF